MITLTLGHVILLQKFRQSLGEQVPQLDLAEGIVVGYIGASLGLLGTAQACSDGVHEDVHGGLPRHLPLASVDGLAVDPEHGIVGDVGVHKGDAVGGCVLGKLLADIPNEEAQILTVGLGIGHREGVGFSLHPRHSSWRSGIPCRCPRMPRIGCTAPPFFRRRRERAIGRTGLSRPRRI